MDVAKSAGFWFGVNQKIPAHGSKAASERAPRFFLRLNSFQPPHSGGLWVRVNGQFRKDPAGILQAKF